MTARTPGEAELWHRLVVSSAGKALAAQVDALLARDGRPTPAQLTAWRNAAGGVDEANAAVELVRARRASGWKFRDIPVDRFCGADDIALDVHGGEQATAWPIARHKARRIVERLGVGRVVVDACCGVGADARELIAAGLEVQGIDLDPVRAWMCGHNAGCATEVADAASLKLGGFTLHIDPARRTESRAGTRTRLHALDDLLPPIATVAALATDAAAAAVKLGPGVNAADLPALRVPTSLEYISLDGQLLQAVWWIGPLTDDAPVRASVLAGDGAEPFSLAGDPSVAADVTHAEAPLGAHIYAVDPAIERAGLLTALSRQVGLVVVHPALGLLTDDPGVRGTIEHPALTPFIVRDAMPWRRERVAAWLRNNNAGLVEVKTRAKACDPDVEQRELRAEGSTPFCVFVLRFGDSVRAIITERPGRAST